MPTKIERYDLELSEDDPWHPDPYPMFQRDDGEWVLWGDADEEIQRLRKEINQARGEVERLREQNQRILVELYNLRFHEDLVMP